jgi:hypothetical protein
VQAASLERGQVLQAEFQLRGLGTLQQAVVRLENQTCGWHLKALELQDPATGDR